MLAIYSCLLLAAATIAASSSVGPPSAQITAAPNAREVELRKRDWYYSAYYPDYTETTTCGTIPYAIASQNGLSTTAAGSPFQIICDCLCAESGNYVGCVDVSTGLVPTTCHEYAPDATPTCFADQDCSWDLWCESEAPQCQQFIYSGSLTQFTCGSSAVAPMTVEGANITMFTRSTVENTSAAPTSSPSSTSGSDSSDAASDIESRLGISLAALIGICVGGFILLCGGCCSIAMFTRRRKRLQNRPVSVANYQQPPQYAPQPQGQQQYVYPT